MKNMGVIDRLARLAIVAAMVIAWGAGIISGGMAVVLLVIAAVLLLTAMVRFCPLYRLLGVSTSRSRR